MTSQLIPATAAPERSTARLVGLDLARGLAVFGMYAAHVGPDPGDGGVTGHLMELSHGRASALFAVLAGVAIVIIAGRRTPRTGPAGRQAVAKIVIRALVLLALGTALTMTGTPVEVILAAYGLCFLLALPLVRLRAGTLAVIAAGWALTGPQLLFVLQGRIDGRLGSAVEAHDPLARIGADGVLPLLFTGSYPVLTWMPFVIAGMALGRLDLADAAERMRLAVAGPALAVAGYGGSWLALHLIPGVRAAIAGSGWGGGSAGSAWWSDTAGYPTGDTPAWLWAASPHSETTLSIIGNTGVAVTVVVAALAVADRLPRLPLLRRLAGPVIAVGAMSLSAYVFHIAGVALLGIEELPGSSLLTLTGFVVAVTVAAVVWSRRFSRGPLEHLVHAATKLYRPVTRGPVNNG